MPRGVSRYRAAERQTILELDTRTLTALTGDVDDYDLSASGACFNIGGSGADRTIKGIAGGREGRFIELVNVLGYNIFLQNEATSSVAGNRILTGLPANASYQIPPNGAILLSYNNTVNRWVVMHGAVTFTPEVDANLACLFRNKALLRSGGALANSGLAIQNLFSGALKLALTVYTGGDISSQAFGAVTSIRASFTMRQAGTALVIIMGTHNHTVVESTTVAYQFGARFDSDTAQELGSANGVVGSGGDYWAQFPFTGIWGKSLAAGAHTADLCWGNASGQSAVLNANSTIPAVIAVLYPG